MPDLFYSVGNIEATMGGFKLMFNFAFCSGTKATNHIFVWQSMIDYVSKHLYLDYHSLYPFKFIGIK